jgi:hypothetical protein
MQIVVEEDSRVPIRLGRPAMSGLKGAHRRCLSNEPGETAEEE